jgi:transcriptional regulator with XRE-family HTH domain
MTSRKPDENDKAKGRELARLRKAAGLSQDRFATQLEISLKQLGKYERGQSRIPAGRYEAMTTMLRNLAGALDGFAESQAPYAAREAAKEVLQQGLDRLDADLRRWKEALKSL